MMTEIVTRAPDEIELQSVETSELHNQLGAAIGLTHSALRRVAALWCELERRGEDMQRHKFALSPFLPGINEGRVLPELVVQMAGQTRALSRLAELPLRDQEDIYHGRPLVIYRGGDRVDEKPLTEMVYAEIAQAVRDGRIVSLNEQKMAANRASRSRSKKRRGRPVRVSVDCETQMLIVGKSEVEIERVLAALRGGGYLSETPE